MSVTFTKLFSSITESTVWCEPTETRIVWITMLAMADKHGRVWGSIPGLANRARVSVEAAREAIRIFLSPDADSRTKDHEGRRIREMDGGWALLNHGKYRAIRDEEERRAYKAEKERTYRAAKRGKTSGQNGQSCTGVDSCGHNAEAEADTVKSPARKKRVAEEVDFRFTPFKECFEQAFVSHHQMNPVWDGREGKHLKDFLKATPKITIDHWNQILVNRFRSADASGVPLSAWIRECQKFYKAPLDEFKKPVTMTTSFSKPDVPDSVVAMRKERELHRQEQAGE